MHGFTGFQPEENIVQDVRRLAQEAQLAEVMAEYVIELLDRHGQQHSDEYWEEMAEELRQWRRRRK
jgi:hypothetical protein